MSVIEARNQLPASLMILPSGGGEGLTDETSYDTAGFASCYGPHRRSPCRAFDAGLQPRPFPGEAASLLPGLLAATRTGLPPAGDDELTTTKKHHGTTSRCHLPFCWAHEKPRLVPRWRGLLAGSARQRRADSRLLVFSGSGADDAEVAAAAHLDPLADRFRHGRARLAGALGPLRATGTALTAGGP